MPRVAIYLRKSREDERLEKELGKGETLALHRRDLLRFARESKLDILKVYEELVSGESLLYRPAMLELLKEVESGRYDGVLVMDMQRLGRGDLEEQGMILKAFKKSNTQIITPRKTYDLDDEFDEEYSEFEAFMSRKEYKMINKRLRRGVMRSVEDGNYVGTYRPYGYDILKLKNGRTLEIKKNEADIVKMVYGWYIDDVVGSQIISDRLNSMGIRTTRGNKWTCHSVCELIKNPVYCGKIAYNRRYGYRSANKKKAVKNRDKSEWLIVEGKHEGIVSEAVYEKAIDIMSHYQKSPTKPSLELNNALAGIVICGVCGAKMTYRTYTQDNTPPALMCREKCGNVSSKFTQIEKAVLDEVKNILDKHKEIEQEKESSKNDDIKAALESQLTLLLRQKEEIAKQRENAYDFLEKGIYTIEVFTERSALLHERLNAIEIEIEKQKTKIKDHEISTDIKGKIKVIETVLEAYEQAATPGHKNMLLKAIIEKVIYHRDNRKKDTDFEIQVISRIGDMSTLLRNVRAMYQHRYILSPLDFPLL